MGCISFACLGVLAVFKVFHDLFMMLDGTFSKRLGRFNPDKKTIQHIQGNLVHEDNE